MRLSASVPLVLLLGLLAGFPLAILPVQAQPAPEPQVSDKGELLVRVSSQAVNEDYIQLNLEFGSVFQRAAMVYSEPSHQLLTVVYSPGFEQTPPGRSLLREARNGKSFAILKSPLPQSRPGVMIPNRPAGDNALSVWTIEENGEEVAVAQVVLGERQDFSFATYAKLDIAKRWFAINHCCEREHCSNEPKCKECDTAWFTCCACGSISCGQAACPPPT